MKKNLPILTGLRFFAAFYVFIFHANLYLKLNFLGPKILTIVSQGAVGVNVFFILSGFILFYNYYNKKINFFEFILKRLAKIYPVYLVGLVLCLVMVTLLQSKVGNFFEIIMMNLLLVQSYLPTFSMIWYGGGSWSISTEFFFYLCFPFLLFYILKQSKKRVLLFMIICYILSFLPGILFNLKLINFPRSYSFPLSRIWEFIGGMLTASLVVNYKVIINNTVIIFIIALSSIFFIFYGQNLEGWTIQNIVVIPIMVIILISSSTSEKNLLSFLGNKFFEYLGKISYSFYIIQIPIMILLERNPEFIIVHKIITFIIIFCVNIFAAILLYEIVESPTHKFLNKKIKYIFPKKEVQLS